MTILKDGYIPTNELLLPLIIMEHPELFNLYFGDFKYLLPNYFGKSSGKDKVVRLLYDAKEEDNHSKVCAIAKQLLLDKTLIVNEL